MPRKPEPAIPTADLARFEVPVRRAVRILRERADRLRMKRFEPVGAALEEENARALDDLLAILEPTGETGT